MSVSDRHADLTAPTLADLLELASAAKARLPETFRALIGDVVVLVEEFPSEDIIESMGLESPFDILGLFEGVGLVDAPAVANTGQMPNRITIYRRPILDYWAEHEETLGHLVTHVLVHEIGHHFGLSDADMEAIEAAAGDA